VTYRSPMILRLAAAVAATAALALPAAAQAAPVLNPLKSCYVSVGVDPATGDAITENIELSGSGFTPNSTVRVVVDGATVATNVPIDAAGNLGAGTVKAPLNEKGQRPFDVTITEEANAQQTVTAQSLVTNLTVRAKPRRARPSRRITFSGRGFTLLERPVYAHYVRAGKLRKTVRLAAKPTGPCGTFRAKRRQFPFKPRTGRWILQVDQQKTYASQPASAFVKLEILVRKVIRMR